MSPMLLAAWALPFSEESLSKSPSHSERTMLCCHAAFCVSEKLSNLDASLVS